MFFSRTSQERNKNKRCQVSDKYRFSSDPGDRFNEIHISFSPAFMKTNLFQRWLKSDEEVEELVQERAKLVPLGRKNVKVDDVIDAIMFLASDRAKMITGTCLFVDGARHLTGI